MQCLTVVEPDGEFYWPNKRVFGAAQRASVGQEKSTKGA